MDRLTSMSVFVSVVDTGSFTTASERLAISRASASKHISELETALGGRLLNRTTRQLSLTEAGQAYYERCKQILEDVGDAACVVSGLSSEPRGVLRINAPMSFGLNQFNGIINRFCQVYPDIAVDLSLNDRLIDVVDEGFDLVIRIARLEDSTLVARKLANCRRVIVASPAYLQEHGTPARPEDLNQHHCLHYSYFETGREWLLKGPTGYHRITTHGPLTINNGDAICRSTIEGMGIALLPTFIVSDALRSGKLKTILCDYKPPDVTAYAVYPSNRQLPNKVRSFIDFAIGEIGETPPWDIGLNIQESSD